MKLGIAIGIATGSQILETVQIQLVACSMLVRESDETGCLSHFVLSSFINFIQFHGRPECGSIHSDPGIYDRM